MRKILSLPQKSFVARMILRSGSDSTSTSPANPLKKISTNPTQSDDDGVKKEKADSTSTSPANPLKKIRTNSHSIRR